MADHTFQIVDDNDVVLFDLNDLTGATNPYGLKTALVQDLDLGEIDTELSLFQSASSPGGILTRKRHPLARVSWHQRADASDSDSLRAGVGALLSLIDQGGILKWQPDDAADPTYMDFLPGSLPALLRGQSMAIHKIVELFKDAEGLPLSVPRQPYLRGVELSSDTNLLTNDSMLRTADEHPRPNGLIWDSVTTVVNESIDYATESYKFGTNTLDVRVLSFPLVAAAPGQDWSFAVDGKVAGVGRLKARIEFVDGGGATLGGVHDSAYAAPAAFGRPFVSAQAPANTVNIRCSIVCVNSAAGTSTYYVRRAQAEKATAPTKYVPATQTLSADPFPATARAIEDFNYAAAQLNTWSNAKLGGAWSLDAGAASAFDIDGTNNDFGSATITPTAANQEFTASLSTMTSVRHVDILAALSLATTAAGADAISYVLFRRTAATTFYRLRIKWRTDGKIYMGLDKVIAGAVTNLVADADTGLTYVGGTTRRTPVRIRVTDDGTNVTIKAKIWTIATSEPSAWTLTTTNNDATLLAASGKVGLGVIYPAGSTGLPVFRFGYLAAYDIDPAIPRDAGRVIPVYIHGDAPAPVRVKLLGGAGSKLEQVIVGVRSNGGREGSRDLPGYLNTSKFFSAHRAILDPDGVNAPRDVDYDAGASRSLVAFAGRLGRSDDNGPLLSPSRAFRVEVTDVESLRGEFDVYLRVAPEASLRSGAAAFTTGVWQLRWAPSLANPVVVSEPEVTFDLFNITPLGTYIDVRLGRIRLSETDGLAGLALELWHRIAYSGGSGCAFYGGLILVPTELTAVQSAPYIARSVFLGKDLTTFAGYSAGTTDGNAKTFAASTSGGKNPSPPDGATPNAGYALGAARWRANYRYSLVATSATTDIRFEVYNETDAAIVRTAKITTNPDGSAVKDRINALAVVEFDSVAGKKYSLRVKMQTRGGAATVFTLHDQRLEQIAQIGANEVLRSDPENFGISKFDASGALVADWATSGQQIWLPPGLNMLYLDPLESRQDLYPAFDSVASRTHSVGISYAPRTFA